MNSLADIVRGLSQPLSPIQTQTQPRLEPLAGVRAVLFDVYGTLLISASGDIGVAKSAARTSPFVMALRAVGVEPVTDIGPDTLYRQIEMQRARAIGDGVAHPEVDILEVWRDTIGELQQQGSVTVTGPTDYAALAVEFECRSNPVWPMPGASDCLRALRQRGLILGLISNAQFYTPLIVDTLLGDRRQDLGLAPDLELYSYRLRRAKPGSELYDEAVARLHSRGIAADEVLYVGNDMLNDVAAGARAGFRTALFAGDARSLRWREGDERVAGIRPGVVVTDLGQLGSTVSQDLST